MECRQRIYKTVLSMADLMEGSAINGYDSDFQSEKWFEVHVWMMIDEYMMNRKSIDILTAEQANKASWLCKNGYFRAAGKHKKMGWRVDGLFQMIIDRLEIGGIELRSQNENRDGTKFAEGGLRLQKMLNDQFNCTFHQKPNVDKQEIEMLDLQLLGRSVQVISINCVGGLFL